MQLLLWTVYRRDQNIQAPLKLLAAGTIFTLLAAKHCVKLLGVVPEEHYRTNANYLFCSTLGVHAHFAARAAHCTASTSSSSSAPCIYRSGVYRWQALPQTKLIQPHITNY